MGPFILIIIIVSVLYIWFSRRRFLVRNHHGQVLTTPTVQVPPAPEYDLQLYQKKSFLFDTTSEFRFFSVLRDIVGPDYCVFPQINYSHLVIPNSGSFYQDRKYRSHIERKSADFVICDKQTYVPRLVVDLDGGIHNRPDIQAKDAEIDSILRAVGLPIIRITNDEIENVVNVKNRILAVLKK
jgi:hypothetical protein